MSLSRAVVHVADVRVSEQLDAVFVTPRGPSSGSEVYAELRRSLGPGFLRRSAEGIRVPAENVTALEGTPDLDLRWSAEARRFQENRQFVATQVEAQLETVKEIKEKGVVHARALIADLSACEVLDPHQVVNVAAMTAPGGFGLCVFDEQGAGKTVTMIYAFDLLVARDEADLLLIVAPKSMVPEWPADFRRFKDDLYRTVMISGLRREKHHALKRGADVLVTNFETAVGLEAELRALLRPLQRRAVLAVDESFFIKSLDAQRTRALRRLREWCGRAFVLCGTPAPNAPHDLVQQFSLVDYGHAFAGVDIPKDRTAAMPIVQEAIEARGLYVRHLKAQVLPGLPQKRFQRVYVPLEPEQRRAYEGALRDLIVDLEAVSDADFQKRIPNFLARRAALLQICSNPTGVVPGYREVPAKLRALDGLLDELVGVQREKVVVWSFFTASIDAIVARYSRHGLVRYDGSVADVAQRREAVRRFQHDPDTMLFVANPAAAGSGLTLHRARVAVYESLSNQAAHYLQSLDRIHRRGQTRPVDYIVLLGEHTVEVDEYERLLRKEAVAQQLLSDETTVPPTRETLLADFRKAAELLSEM
jgi:SNF2 family DNA or RNA helicase